MIELITDLPNHVLGFKASGRVTADDYQTVVVPAIETTLRKTKYVRLLYVLGEDFEGYTGAAAWEDAKVGLGHLTRFDRIAVVSDVDWIETTVKAFGFVMPCEVRVFDNKHLHEARVWITEPPVAGTLSAKFLDQQGVLVLRPHGELVAADFERASAEIDPFIAREGHVRGVMIVADKFPGWDDLAALAAHLRFVKDHRKNVERLAIVTDDRLLSAMPYIASHFLVREARHFPASEEAAALGWLGQA